MQSFLQLVYSNKRNECKIDLSNVFDQFLPQLLRYPNPMDPLNGEAASTYLHHPDQYAHKVKGALLPTPPCSLLPFIRFSFVLHLSVFHCYLLRLLIVSPFVGNPAGITAFLLSLNSFKLLFLWVFSSAKHTYWPPSPSLRPVPVYPRDRPRECLKSCDLRCYNENI